jgi:hypothetical protein
MSLTEDQKHQFSRLIKYRDNISSSLFYIESILKDYFPDEHSLAYQHWIPQILTALQDDDRWLSRGEYSMQDTIDRINDTDSGSGVTKYIQ